MPLLPNVGSRLEAFAIAGHALIATQTQVTASRAARGRGTGALLREDRVMSNAAASGRQVESGRDRRQAKVRLAAPGDDDLLPGRGAFHVPAEAVAELVGADDGGCGVGGRSGARGTRTPGLLTAGQALFQLSYSPKWVL